MVKSFILLLGPLVCWPSHCQAVAVTSGITDPPFNRDERLYFHFITLQNLSVKYNAILHY